MRRMSVVLCAIGLAMVGLVGLQPAAQAVGTGAPTIAVQRADATILSFSVDFTDAPAGDYLVQANDGAVDRPTVGEGAAGLQYYSVPNSDAATSWVIEVFHYSDTGDADLVASGSFTVTPPPPPAPAPTTVTTSLPSPNWIYSTVRDGYKDSTSLVYTTNRTALVRLDVLRDGRLIRTSAATPVGMGAHRWSWGGGQNSGGWAPVGLYLMRVIVRGEDGTTATSSRYVRVVTGTATGKTLQARTGVQASWRGRSSDCRIYRDSTTYSALTLDCYGGYAYAAYRFALPRGTTRTSYYVSGEVGCCSPGQVAKSAYRSGNLLTVYVDVTGWRAYTTHRVTIAATATRRT